MQELLESVDTLIVIPNEKLLAVAKDAGFFESFRIADDVLRQAVQGISDIITIPGVINRDFADVKTTMAGMGHAVMGTAQRSGQSRAMEAAMAAMASPLLEAGAIDGARGILINITGSSSLKLSEVNEASGIIQSAAHEDANIIFGAVQDEAMGDEVKITVIATGFKQQEMPQRRERMLAEATLPTMRYDVPIQARVPAQRTPTPYGAETDIQPRKSAEPVFESSTSTQLSVAEAGASPELVPVPASVFDDAFFRSSPEQGTTDRSEDDVDVTEDNAEGFREGSHFSPPLRVQQDNIGRAMAASPVADPVVRGASFGDAVGGTAESDELDIPAFLRRGN
jgi:cell division protein FtsZ